MSKTRDNAVKLADTLNNIQYELEDARDLVKVLYVSLRNQVSLDNKLLGIVIDEGHSIYPVGEGLSGLARDIEQRLDNQIKLIEDTYNTYVKEDN